MPRERYGWAKMYSMRFSCDDGRLDAYRENAHSHEVNLGLAIFGLKPTADCPYGDVIIVNCGVKIKRGSIISCISLENKGKAHQACRSLLPLEEGCPGRTFRST